jgi:hypothetical protein
VLRASIFGFTIYWIFSFKLRYAWADVHLFTYTDAADWSQDCTAHTQSSKPLTMKLGTR